MDVSHILVGALTAVAFAWLVWAEIHSRRNSADKGEDPVGAVLEENHAPPREAQPQCGKNHSAKIGSRHMSRSLSR
jgi:hypothetical protein